MKELRLSDKMVNNFYWRNIAMLFIIFSGATARRVYQFGGFDKHSFGMSAINFFVLYLLIVFHNRVLYEFLLRKKRILIYLAATLTVIYLYNDLVLTSVRSLFQIEWDPETISDKLLLLYTDLIDVYIGLAIYIGFNYFKEREDKLKLEYLKREVELKQLQTQLHPHFLFNALNNIYSYSIEKNRRSDELVLKLSELMRYIIENTNKDLVPLVEEIRFIEHYIAFERERLGDRCKIEFTMQVADTEAMIAPLLLFTFIENAFKHGTATMAHTFITISLTVDENSIQLYITNPLSKTAHPSSTHTGLTNTRRRLELIYPKRYKLGLLEDDHLFKTSLLIEK